MGAAEGGEGVDEWGGLEGGGEGPGGEGGGEYILMGWIWRAGGWGGREEREPVGVTKRKDAVGGMPWKGCRGRDAVGGMDEVDAAFLLRRD